MAEKLCPMDKPACHDNCQWNMNGECAVKVIAKALTEKLAKIPKAKG